MTQEFNWIQCEQMHNPKHYGFLKENHNKPLTEEEFVKGMQDIRSFSKSSKHYSPYNLKKMYKNLKEKFGFFK